MRNENPPQVHTSAVSHKFWVAGIWLNAVLVSPSAAAQQLRCSRDYVRYRYTAWCCSFVLHKHHNKPAPCTSLAASSVATTEHLLSKKRCNGYNATILDNVNSQSKNMMLQARAKNPFRHLFYIVLFLTQFELPFLSCYLLFIDTVSGVGGGRKRRLTCISMAVRLAWPVHKELENNTPTVTSQRH